MERVGEIEGEKGCAGDERFVKLSYFDRTASWRKFRERWKKRDKRVKMRIERDDHVGKKRRDDARKRK